MRGGKRTKLPTDRGASALLEALWKHFGGPANVSIITGVSPQTLVNWRLRGKVPVKQVFKIAKALNIPHWGLNYAELSEMFEDAPTWKQVVASYKLEPSMMKYIFGFKDLR